MTDATDTLAMAGLLTMIGAQLGSRLSHVPPRAARRDPALVLVAHGSRDPRALATVTALVDEIRTHRPGLTVRLGHIELNEPLLPDVLHELPAGRAVLVPLLLSRGYHVKRDIPELADAAQHLLTRVAAPLGPHPLLVDALQERVTQTQSQPQAQTQTQPQTQTQTQTQTRTRPTGVVLAAAGSRDPDSVLDTRRTATLLAHRLGVPVEPAFASATGPGVADAVRALGARGSRRPVLASYFTAPGRFATETAAAFRAVAGPDAPVAAPLGAHPAVARLILHRYDTAQAAPVEHGSRLASA